MKSLNFLFLMLIFFIIQNRALTQSCNNLKASNIMSFQNEEFAHFSILRERYSTIVPREAELRYRKSGNTNWITRSLFCEFDPYSILEPLEPYRFDCDESIELGLNGELYEMEFRIRCDVEGWGEWVRKNYRTICEPVEIFISTNNHITPSSISLESEFMDQAHISQNEGQSFFKTQAFNNGFCIFNNLNENQEYWTQHRVQCDNNNWSQYSNLEKSTTLCSTPKKSELDLNLNMQSKLVASSTKFANKYKFQIRKKGTTQWQGSGEISNSQFTFPTSIVTGEIYEVQSQVNCGEYTNWTNWSDSKEFMIPVDCPKPISSEIGVNNISNSTAHFFCKSGHNSGVIDAHVFRYRVQNSGSWTEQTISNKAIDVDHLEDNADYEMQVRHECTNGVNGEWSNSINFKTDPDCNVSADKISLHNIAQTSVTIMCSQQNRDGYTWDVRKVSTGQKINIPNPVLTHTYELTGLDQAEEYDVKLKVHCDPVVSDFSEPIRFTTLECGQADISQFYVTGITNTTAVFGYSGSTIFVIDWQYRKVGNTGWKNRSSTGHELFVDSLIKNSDYEFRIRLQCNDDPVVKSPWSDTKIFSTLCEAFMNRFSNITETSLTSHSNEAQADSYTFRYRRAGSNPWTEIPTVVPFVDVLSLTADTEYEFQVKSTCNGNTGVYSASDFVETDAQNIPPCNTPTRGQMIANNVTSRTAELTCTKGNVDGYYFRYGDGVSTTQSGLLNTGIFNIQGLNPSTIYGFQTKVKCSNIESAWSDTVYFVTRREVMSLVSGCHSPKVSELIPLAIGSSNVFISCAIESDMYQFRYKDSASKNWIELTEQTENRKLLINLIPKTIYEFQCRLKCGSLIGTYSDSRYFGTQSSTNCDSSSAYNFGALRIGSKEVSLVSASQSRLIQFRYKKLDDPDWTYTDTSSKFFINVYDLEPNQNYMYQLRLMCLNTKISEYSTSKFFTTLQACVVNNSDMDAHTISTTSAYLKSNIQGTLAVVFRYRKLGETVWQKVRSIISSEIKVENLSPDTEYEYELWVVCGEQNYSQWSATKKFKTLMSSAAREVENQAWRVFPVPTDKTIYIVNPYIESLVEYEILNMLGVKVSRGELYPSHASHINLDLLPGAYNIILHSQGQRVNKRILLR